jgi:hypothetical protein
LLLSLLLFVGAVLVLGMGKEITKRIEETVVARLHPDIVEDSATGCQYILSYDHKGMSIRYNSSGQPMCRSFKDTPYKGPPWQEDKHYMY